MIETERLYLRNWRKGDAALLHRHCNTPKVMRWLGGVRRADFMVEIAERLASYQEDYGHTFWVAERKSDGAFLGFCGLKKAEETSAALLGETEIGWRFREDCWGKGYAKEAALASLDHAFRTVGAPRVLAFTVEPNKNSWGLMRRIGMRRRQDLDYVDLYWPEPMNTIVVYEITSDMWSAAAREDERAC